MSYCVLLDENFHYQGPESRWTLGTFDTAEAAISACRKMVDDDLIILHESGMAADALLAGYRALSDEPFIVGGRRGHGRILSVGLRRGKVPSHPTNLLREPASTRRSAFLPRRCFPQLPGRHAGQRYHAPPIGRGRCPRLPAWW
jgi:hypothetical protein